MLHNKVTVIIVTWNSMNFIYDCLESLSKQTTKEFSTIVVDNNSSDGTVQYIRSNYPTVSILQNFQNTGFAYANNQGMKLAKTEYVLLINPDIILNENFIEKIVDCALKHPHGASFTGKILKLMSASIDPESIGKGLRTPIRSNIIDTVGISILKNRKAIHRGEGKENNNIFMKEEQIFGVSGCCVLYKREALEGTKIYNQYFDESYFAYKEDVDLAWRLKMYGWEAWYTPDAVAYHYRGFSAPSNNSSKKIVESRKKVSKMLRSLSFTNHHITIIKNDFLSNIFFHSLHLIVHECKVILYAIFFEKFLLKNILKIIKMTPQALKKRKVVMTNKKISAKEMRAWFT